MQKCLITLKINLWHYEEMFYHTVMVNTTPRKKPQKFQRTLRLTAENSRRVDALARQKGISYSAVVNLILDGTLKLEDTPKTDTQSI